MPVDPFTIQRFGISIVCADLDRSMHFYEEILGAIRDHRDGYGCPWYTLGQTSLSLVPNAGEPNASKLGCHSMAMLRLETSDLQAAEQRFIENHVEILQASGGGSMIIADPDGIAIEIWKIQP